MHVHALFWCRYVEAVDRPSVAKATVPTDNSGLRSVVLGSQPSDGGSGREIRNEPSEWDQNAGLLHLQHLPRDFWMGLRAYLVVSHVTTF